MENILKFHYLPTPIIIYLYLHMFMIIHYVNTKIIINQNKNI